MFFPYSGEVSKHPEGLNVTRPEISNKLAILPSAACVPLDAHLAKCLGSLIEDTKSLNVQNIQNIGQKPDCWLFVLAFSKLPEESLLHYLEFCCVGRVKICAMKKLFWLRF